LPLVIPDDIGADGSPLRWREEASDARTECEDAYGHLTPVPRQPASVPCAGDYLHYDQINESGKCFYPSAEVGNFNRQSTVKMLLFETVNDKKQQERFQIGASKAESCAMM
jgi:hypothetical protein